MQKKQLHSQFTFIMECAIFAEEFYGASATEVRNTVFVSFILSWLPWFYLSHSFLVHLTCSQLVPLQVRGLMCDLECICCWGGGCTLAVATHSPNHGNVV